MKSIYVALTCGVCGYQTHKQSETLILSDFEPYLKQQLCDGTFFLAQCPRCKKRIDFLHSCLYVDKAHRYVLFIKSAKQRRDSDHTLYAERAWRKRYVSDAASIGELMRILDDGLDDRGICIIKEKLLRRYDKETLTITYLDMDIAQELLWFDIQDGEYRLPAAVPIAAYHDILAALPKEDTAHYLCIDAAWAKQILYEKK